MIYSAKLGTFDPASLKFCFPLPSKEALPLVPLLTYDPHKCTPHFHTISPTKHIHFTIMPLSMIMSLRVSFPVSVSTNTFHIFSLFPCFITAQ